MLYENFDKKAFRIRYKSWSLCNAFAYDPQTLATHHTHLTIGHFAPATKWNKSTLPFVHYYLDEEPS